MPETKNISTRTIEENIGSRYANYAQSMQLSEIFIDLDDNDIERLIQSVSEQNDEVIRSTIRFFVKPKWETTVQEDWPIADEFEDVASNACIDFCNSRGLINDLRNCLQQIDIVFSNVQNVSAEYDCFDADEYEEEGHIVLRVEVSSDQETAFREYDVLTNWMLENIKDENLDFFILTVSRI